MKKRKLDDMYQKQIESLYILHTLFRIENAMGWVNLSIEKKKIVISSLLGILDIKYPNWQDNNIIRQYQDNNLYFTMNMKRMSHFLEDEYRNVEIEEAKNNITKVFK